MRILFITTTNLSSNPRLVKELEIFSKDHHCYVLLFNFRNWTKSTEAALQSEFPEIEFDSISAGQDDFRRWLLATIWHKMCRICYRIVRNSLKIAAFASNKLTWTISSELRTWNHEVDFIMAHNLGALYPAYRLASKRNIPFSFDVEDYHPGEKIRSDELAEVSRREYLMQQILPHSRFISFASPLIGERVLQLMGDAGKPSMISIRNVFNSSDFSAPEPGGEKIKLIWFSQHLNYGRGLEKILPVLDRFDSKIELHLMGAENEEFIKNELEKRAYITTHGSLSQRQLHQSLSNYDVGLALEMSIEDENRNLCLTNKIFAYVQAGLYVLASDTLAQKQFLTENPSLGILCELYPDSLKAGLEYLLNNIERIRVDSVKRWESAKQMSWENEGRILRDFFNDMN